MLKLAAGSLSLWREVFCGSVGLSSGSDQVVHFGLGSAGLGSKLVQEALAALKRQQIKRINLLTSRMTWPANFWKKNGFAESSFIQFMVASL